MRMFIAENQCPKILVTRYEYASVFIGVVQDRPIAGVLFPIGHPFDIKARRAQE